MHIGRHAVAALGCAGALSLAVSAHGQAMTPAAPGRPAKIAAATSVSEVVVTASRPDLLGKAVTASQGSISRQELELRPAYRVGQILEAVPGLVVTVHSGEGKAYQYQLRGFNLDHGTDLASFIDDIPINRPTNAHGQGYTDLNFVIPQVLEGVDYTKGPYYPAIGDFGAVASDHMRLADVIPDQISASGGTLGDYGLFLGGTRTVRANDHLLAAFEYSHVDGPFTPGNDFRKYAGVLRYSSGTPTDGEDLTVLYYKGDGKFTTDQPARAVTEGLIGRFGTLDPSDGNSSERFSVSGHYAAEVGSLSVLTSAYYVHSRQTLWNDFTYFLEDPVNGDQEQQDETRDLVGGAGALKLDSRFGDIDSQTTLGVQGRYDDVYVDRRHTADRRVLDYCELLQPDGSAVEVSVGVPDCTANRAKVADVGFYLDNITRWTSWLRTDVGAREEYYSGQDRSLLAGTEFSRSSFNQSVTLFQPKAGLVLGPWWSTELYLNAGRGFHSDDVRGVSGTVPLEGIPLSAGATPLLVKADGEEIGLRSNLIRDVHIQIAAFNTRFNSELVYDQDQGEDEPGPPSERYGVEVSAEYRPFPWLELNTDLAFSHAQFVDTSPAVLLNSFGDGGNHIPNAPGFIGSFGAIVDNLGPWYGGLQVRALGSYALIADNSERDAGYTETNVSVGYKVSKTVKAQLELFNLFNVRANSSAFYYTTVIPDGRGPTADHQNHPLEPISARATITAYF